jgi:hypothetical protein
MTDGKSNRTINEKNVIGTTKQSNLYTTATIGTPK